jgi:hypothetical protein
MKKWSTSLIIKEMKIKTALKFCLTSVRMPTSERLTTTNVGKNVGRKETSCTISGTVN